MMGAMGPAIAAASGVTARGGAVGASSASSASSGAARLSPVTAAAAVGRVGTTSGSSLSARAALARRSKRLTAPTTTPTNRRAFSTSVTAVAGDRGTNKIKLSNDPPPRPFFDSKEANDVSGYTNFGSREELKVAAMVGLARLVHRL